MAPIDGHGAGMGRGLGLRCRAGLASCVCVAVLARSFLCESRLAPDARGAGRGAGAAARPRARLCCLSALSPPPLETLVALHAGLPVIRELYTVFFDFAFRVSYINSIGKTHTTNSTDTVSQTDTEVRLRGQSPAGSASSEYWSPVYPVRSRLGALGLGVQNCSRFPRVASLRKKLG